jgi:hypothetical protein
MCFLEWGVHSPCFTDFQDEETRWGMFPKKWGIFSFCGGHLGILSPKMGTTGRLPTIFSQMPLENVNFKGKKHENIKTKANMDIYFMLSLLIFVTYHYLLYV